MRYTTLAGVRGERQSVQSVPATCKRLLGCGRSWNSHMQPSQLDRPHGRCENPYRNRHEPHDPSVHPMRYTTHVVGYAGRQSA